MSQILLCVSLIYKKIIFQIIILQTIIIFNLIINIIYWTYYFNMIYKVFNLFSMSRNKHSHEYSYFYICYILINRKINIIYVESKYKY